MVYGDDEWLDGQKQIRCTECERWLASLRADGVLVVACPRCRRLHEVPLEKLVADYLQYARSLEEQVRTLERMVEGYRGEIEGDGGEEVVAAIHVKAFA